MKKKLITGQDVEDYSENLKTVHNIVMKTFNLINLHFANDNWIIIRTSCFDGPQLEVFVKHGHKTKLSSLKIGKNGTLLELR